MARDESKSAQAALERQKVPEEQPKAPDSAPQATAPQADAPAETVATVAADTVESERPDVRVQLDPDSDLEAPVALSVAGLYQDREPLPTPDAIRDDDENFLPGYDENTPTLVVTENGLEHPDGDPEPVVPVDEHGRLVLDSSPVTLPATVADVVAPLPFVKVVTD